MAQELIALRADQFTDSNRRHFVETFSSLFYSGQGSAGNFRNRIGVNEVDGLRVFLGMTLTEPQQRVFEATYAYTMNLPIVPRPELWADATGWTPRNPRHEVDTPISHCRLDLDFMDSFGLRRSIWEKEILFANLGALETKISRRDDLSATNLRLYIALATFGFTDPAQFFA